MGQGITPLFIGGTGRSGTTILWEYLKNNSKIASADLPEFRLLTAKNGLLDLYENNDLNTFKTYIGNALSNREDGMYRFIHSLKDTDITDLMNKLSNNFYLNPKKSIENFYFNSFDKKDVIKNDKKYLIDSTPENIKRSDVLLKIFPNSKFIHMIRDGRDSGYSEYVVMKDYKFSSDRKTPFEGLDYWHKRIVQSHKSLEKISENLYLNIRLENLVDKNIEKEKEKIINFLNINNENKMENFFLTKIKKEFMHTGIWKHMSNWKEYDEKYKFILEDLKKQNIFIEKYY